MFDVMIGVLPSGLWCGSSNIIAEGGGAWGGCSPAVPELINSSFASFAHLRAVYMCA